MNTKHYEYLKKFRRETYKIFNVYFNKEKEKDLIDFVLSHGDKTKYIKNLIIEDMKKKES